jgi:hypothetical protein
MQVNNKEDTMDSNKEDTMDSNKEDTMDNSSMLVMETTVSHQDNTMDNTMVLQINNQDMEDTIAISTVLQEEQEVLDVERNTKEEEKKFAFS